MKDRRRERGVGMRLLKYFGEVLELTAAARGDYRDGYRFNSGPGDFDIESLPNAVGVHTRQEDFACAAVFHFLNPFHGVAFHIFITAVRIYRPPLIDTLNVNGDYDTLGAEQPGAFGDETGIQESRCIDADLVGALCKNIADIINGRYASSYGKGDEQFLGDRPRQVNDRFPALQRCGNVQKDKFVCAFGIVILAELDRVSRIGKSLEVYTFTTRPSLTSRHGIIRFASIRKNPPP